MIVYIYTIGLETVQYFHIRASLLIYILCTDTAKINDFLCALADKFSLLMHAN